MVPVIVDSTKYLAQLNSELNKQIRTQQGL
jgi:hypothetical protein